MSIVKRNKLKALIQAELNKVAHIGVDKSNKADIDSSATVKADNTNTIAIKPELELFNASIDANLSQLKKFLTLEEKDKFKAEAIEKDEYIDYVDRYLASGEHYPNKAFTWIFIWLVDLGHWQQVLNYLPHLITQQQHLPKVFNTKEWTTFLIDQLYDAGSKELQEQQKINERTPEVLSKSQIINVFNSLIAFVEKEKPVVNDVVLGKLYTMAAKLEYVHFNLGNSLNLCLKATKTNDKAGVKKLAKDIAKNINKNITI